MNEGACKMANQLEDVIYALYASSAIDRITYDFLMSGIKELRAENESLQMIEKACRQIITFQDGAPTVSLYPEPVEDLRRIFGIKKRS